MKPLILLSLCMLALTACNPQAQFITLRGSNVKPTDDGLVLDTDTLSLRYQFYSERGVIHLTIFNKTDRPLYVNWKKSAFIIGSDKFDYWYDVATVNLTGSAYSYRYSRYATVGLGGTITKDDPIGFIPPKTQLQKYEFVVVPGGPLRLVGTPTQRQET